MVWVATTMGFVGLMVRWRESYLISHDIGHIPVSNLYEVFILFAIITALIYLFYEARTRTKAMGAFVLLVISASIAFLLWYHFEKGAHEIEPLVPALQSYWMKIHVPANFVGYGAFALAAMLGVLYLIRENAARGGGTSKIWMVVMNLVGLGILGYALFFVSSTVNTLIFVVSALFLLAIYYLSIQKQRVLSYFPPAETIDEVMHKSIALGFAFFTVATVLGAMWAAEAWGGYWSWDPKETWALIVWLNYAAWLHMRLTKGWRGAPLAWWAIIGLFVTTFAFLGVNMFLSGLHSYGEL
nr:c-type cytochrome biogenesis protein CcsB [Thiohalophilus thiocyanatoxydans]